MEYIIILGAFQALVGLGLFFDGRNKKPADSLLKWMLICMVTHLSIKFVIYLFSGNNAIKTAFNTFIDLAYGPLLWAYACKIKNDAYRPSRHWYFFLPAFFAAIVYIVIVAGLLKGSSSAMSLLEVYNNITRLMILLTFFIFPLMAWRLANTLSQFWQMEKNLIKKIALAFMAMCVSWIIAAIMENFNIIQPAALSTPLRISTYAALLAISVLIVFYRWRSQHLFKSSMIDQLLPGSEKIAQVVPAVVISEPAIPISTEQGQLRKTLLIQQQQALTASTLINIMQTKKNYANPDLTLENLASILNIPRNQVSETLNQYVGKSFYQFINEFRVKEVIRLMDNFKKQGINPNILSLAFDAGFQSKTTFYQYFKRATGQTPSEYLKNHPTARLQHSFSSTT